MDRSGFDVYFGFSLDTAADYWNPGRWLGVGIGRLNAIRDIERHNGAPKQIARSVASTA